MTSISRQLKYPTLKQVEKQLNSAKHLLASEYKQYFKNTKFDANLKRLCGADGYFLQYNYPSVLTGSLGSCELYQHMGDANATK